RSYLAWIAITIAIFIKMQMVVLLPILILVTWQRKGIRTLLGGFGVSWLTFVLTLLPFIYYHKIDRIIDRVFSAVGEYPFLSMNAYNLWWLIGLGRLPVFYSIF
ncbi:MAG: hypothetical protein NT030_03590, partial [Candidatus Saganbacteria bacterium]|nr:hypothetical protein [Candidatus Saganbacteria bacterium]